LTADLTPAERAAGLRAAADELDSVTWQFDMDTCECGDCNLCVWKEAARHLRRKADECVAVPSPA
jgi:hypothetical protein